MSAPHTGAAPRGPSRQRVLRACLWWVLVAYPASSRAQSDEAATQQAPRYKSRAEREAAEAAHAERQRIRAERRHLRELRNQEEAASALDLVRARQAERLAREAAEAAAAQAAEPNPEQATAPSEPPPPPEPPAPEPPKTELVELTRALRAVSEAPEKLPEKRSYTWLSHFRLGIGAEGGQRSFHHRETNGPDRSYKANGFSGVLVVLEIRPPDIKQLVSWSIKADYWHSIALSSWSHDLNRAVNSPSWRANVVAGLLLRMGRSKRAPVIGAGAGVGCWRFDFAMPSAPDRELPTGDYLYARAALSLRVPLQLGFVFTDAAFLYAFDSGPLGYRKVQGAVQGIDYALGFSLPLPHNFEFRLRAAYTLFVGEIAPLPGSGQLPASLTDQYLTLGASWFLRY